MWSRSEQSARRLADAHGIANVVTDDWRQVIEADDRVAALYPPRPGLKGDGVVRGLLQAGEFVGDIHDVRVTSMKRLDPPGQYRWADDPECVGVNAMTLGLWCEVLNRWVGPATTVAAIGAAVGGRRFTETGEAVAAEVPTSLSVTAALECGARASYHLSTGAAFGAGDTIAIHGSNGALVYEMFTDELRGASGESDDLSVIDIPADQVRLQTTDAEFVEAIRDGGTVSPDFEEGVQYMAFSEAVALSCYTGEMVDVTISEPKMKCWGLAL